MYAQRVRVPGGSKFHLAPGTIEGMRSSGELSVEAGGCLARSPARVRIGKGNRYSHTGDQSGLTDSWAITGASLPSVFRDPQGVWLPGQGLMP